MSLRIAWGGKGLCLWLRDRTCQVSSSHVDERQKTCRHSRQINTKTSLLKYFVSVHLFIHMFLLRCYVLCGLFMVAAKWRQIWLVGELIWPFSLCQGYESFHIYFISVIQGHRKHEFRGLHVSHSTATSNMPFIFKTIWSSWFHFKIHMVILQNIFF